MLDYHLTPINLDGAARWSLYQRLQELAIPCTCACHHPLQVDVNSPLAALQLWSAIRRLAAPRTEQLNWLERCWRLTAADVNT